MAYVRGWEALLSPHTQRRVVYLYVCSTNGDASGTPLEVCPVKPSHHHIYMLITQWNLGSTHHMHEVKGIPQTHTHKATHRFMCHHTGCQGARVEDTGELVGVEAIWSCLASFTPDLKPAQRSSCSDWSEQQQQASSRPPHDHNTPLRSRFKVNHSKLQLVTSPLWRSDVSFHQLQLLHLSLWKAIPREGGGLGQLLRPCCTGRQARCRGQTQTLLHHPPLLASQCSCAPWHVALLEAAQQWLCIKNTPPHTFHRQSTRQRERHT